MKEFTRRPLVYASKVRVSSKCDSIIFSTIYHLVLLLTFLIFPSTILFGQEICPTDTRTSVQNYYYEADVLGHFYPLNNKPLNSTPCKNTIGDGARFHAYNSFRLLPSIRFTYDDQLAGNLGTIGAVNCDDERAARIGLMPPYGDDYPLSLVTPSMYPVSKIGSWYTFSGDNFHIGDAFLVSTCGAKDLLLSTNNESSRIKFLTTVTRGEQRERMTILNNGNVGIGTYNPIGRLDVNVGPMNFDLPKISLTSGIVSADPGVPGPQLRFYSNSGNSYSDAGRSTSYSWYIQSLRQYNTHCFAGLDGVIDPTRATVPQSSLHFRTGYNGTNQTGDMYSNIIGTESSIARMTLLSGGNVGINNEIPMVRFNVRDGSVLFDGESGNTPLRRDIDITTGVISAQEIGAGTRLMWIPSKAAFRAGRIDQSIDGGGNNLFPYYLNFWDAANIGQYSFATGHNCKASGLNSIALGHRAEALNINSVAIGMSAIASGENSIALGRVTASNLNSTAVGSNCTASGNSSTVFGFQSIASGNNSVAVGYGTDATGNNTTSLGWANLASAPWAYTFGRHLESSADESFTMGIGYDDGTVHYFSNNTASSVMIVAKSDIPSITCRGGGTGYIGNIGIKTITPCAQFSVEGNAIVGVNWAGDPLMAPLTSTLAVESSIGIGTVSPNNALSVVGESKRITVGNDDSFNSTEAKIDLAVQEKAVIGGNVHLDGSNNDSYKLHVNGDAYKTGSGGAVWNTTSDIRYKKNVVPFVDGLSLLKQINPIWFEYNGKMGVTSTKPQVGVVAQEIQNILPYTVSSDTLSRTILVKAEKRYLIDAIDTSIIRVLDTLAEDSTIVISHRDIKYKDSIIYKSVKKLIVEPAEFKEERDGALSYNANALWYLLINSVKELDSTLISTKDESNKRLTSLEKANIELRSTNDSLQTIINTLQDRFSRLEAQSNIPLKDAMDVILEQNNPNPFSESTTITYYIPETVIGSPELIITHSANPEVIEKFELLKGIPTQFLVSAQNFKTGVYVYSIVVQNKVLASKKFIIIK